MNLIIRWILFSLSIMFVAWIIPDITVGSFTSALFVAIVIGLINTFIKPVLYFITLPINFLTLGIFSLIINAFLLWLAGYFAPNFEVNGFWSAFFGAIILSILGSGISYIGKDK